MGLVSISIRTHFLAFNNGFPSVTPEPIPIATMTPRRRRVIFTLGSLIISILQKLLKRMHISTKPKGKKAKFLYGIEHHWLAILSFFDDHIIVIEKIFPTSTPLFDKIDEFVKASESFPSKFDDFIDHDVPNFMQRVPFLDRVFRKDEKEIVIDITCHGYRAEPENSFEYANMVKSGEDQNMISGEELDATWNSVEVSNLSHVEVIDDVDKEENDSMEDANPEILYSARATSSNDEILQSEDQDPIFELFETGWHKSPRNLSSTSSA